MELPEQFFTIHEQTRLFLGSCLLGLPIGLLLDCFRFLRAMLPHHAIAVFLEDAFFVCAAMLMLQCYAMMFSRGELRFYEAFGAVLGLTLYLLTIGAVWMRMLHRIRHMLGLIRQKAAGIVHRIWRKIKPVFVIIPKFQQKSQKIPENT